MPRPLVIVIDDDPLFRSLLTSMLRKEYAVAVAADGADGYYKALERPPQLAIIDIQMPGWDGFRTLKAFRSNYLLAKVPIMIMTSDASRPTVKSALEGGANDFVVKTALTREEFLAKVTHLVSVVEPRPEYPGRPTPAPAETPENQARDAAFDELLAAETRKEEAILQAIIDSWD